MSTSHLLFFDTFSHDNSNTVQLDLVQFPKPVQVNEVRVIPLGARVKADFPGGVRLGATNPSQFEIEFFVNDLSKKGAAAFENIGSLRYAQHGTIHFEFSKKPPTDGLLLRGCYTTVTLAVYGNPTSVQREPSPKPKADVPVRPLPEKVSTHERIRDWLEDTKRKQQQTFEINSSEVTAEWEAKESASPAEFESTPARKRTEKERKESPSDSWSYTEKDKNSQRQESSKAFTESEKKRDSLKSAKESKRSASKVWTSDEEAGLGKKRNLSEWYDDSDDDQVFSSPIKSPASGHGVSPGSEKEASKEAPIPPPIPTEEMEAISDDEVIPDFPTNQVAEVKTVEQLDEKVAPTETVNVIEETEACEYEEIMSDDDDLPEYQYEEAYVVEEWENWTKTFDPRTLVEFHPMEAILPPTLTRYQIETVAGAEYLKDKKLEEERTALCNKLSSLVNNTQMPSLEKHEKELEAVLDGVEDLGENFVQTMEEVCLLLPKGLASHPEQSDILETLIKWVCCGLSIDIAMDHPQPVYKIRHLKAGIRLCCLLLRCSSEISSSLLKNGVLDQLFAILQQQHLSLSLQLLIISAFDAVVYTVRGLRFLTREKLSNDKTGYERLLEMLSSLQQSRTKSAISVIIRKIHFLETCEKLTSDAERLVYLTNLLIDNDEATEMKNSDHVEGCETAVDFIKIEEEVVCVVNSFISCLSDILRSYNLADQLLVQFARWLPVSKKFQLPKNKQCPYVFVYNVFEATGVFESISMALLTPLANRNVFVLQTLKSFVGSLISFDHGLRYFANKYKTACVIIKTMLQFSMDSHEHFVGEESLNSFGLKLNTMLYIIYQLDGLAVVNGEFSKLSSRDPITCDGDVKELEDLNYEKAANYLNAIESLLMSICGRDAVAAVIGLPNLAGVIFPYLKPDLEPDAELVSIKAACFGYAVDIFLNVVKYKDDIDYLEYHSEELNDLIILWETSLAGSEECSTVAEILAWVSLIKTPNIFSYENFSFLSSLIQENVDRLESFPGELISSLRIACHLAIPSLPSKSKPDEGNGDLVEELKYKYAVIQLYSNDVSTHLIHILSHIFNIYHQPFMHGSSFAGAEGALVIMILKPTLSLLDTILNSVIKARNTEFKDLSAVVPLIQTYILLQAFPNSSPSFQSAQNLKNSIVNILLHYTQISYTTEGEDVLAKSVWTQMLSEILKYLLHAPYCMVPVMTLITELLPLPLPLETELPLTKEESDHMVRLRKLWSAHLYSLAPVLQEVIHRLGLATNPLLTHATRRMCVSLSDLSAPMALVVARVILDLLMQAHRLDQKAGVKEETKGFKEEAKPVTFASQQTARSLKMLASLVSHAATKAAVLHLLKGGALALSNASAKVDDKYTSLIGIWSSILSLPQQNSDLNRYHHSAQEALVCIIYHLVDYQNSLRASNIPEEERELKLEDYNLNGVPPKDLLVTIIEGSLEVIQQSKCSSATIHWTLTTLLCLLDHNYGFFHVKSILDKKKGSLLSLLRHICSTFDGDSIILSKDFLELCNRLICPEDGRSFSVNITDLSSYLEWKKEESNTGTESCPEDMKKEDCEESAEDTKVIGLHSLYDLERLISTECVENDEVYEHAAEDVHKLILMLDDNSCSVPLDMEEPPTQCPIDSLQSQFGSRVLWTSTSDVDHNLYDYWFANPVPVSSEAVSVVPVNIVEMSQKYVAEFDLNAELNKLVKCPGPHSGIASKMTKLHPKYKPSVAAIRPEHRGKAYVAPMRGGRPFVRGLVSRIDTFRSRPPNTSRPPSLHVDDFVALESTGNQPTGPTGYNKISFGRGKMMLDSMRGRGRARGLEMRGRFFHRLPFRGDLRGLNRGLGLRRGTGWIFRGDGLARGVFRGPAHLIQNRFMRIRPFVRGAPLGMPAGMIPKERFPIRFVERGRRELSIIRHPRGFR